MKTKITVEQLERLVINNNKRYKVTALVNRTRPEIGSYLTEGEVNTLLSESDSLTIEVKSAKKK